MEKFIEWVICLSKFLKKRLKEEIKKIEEELKRPYLTSWERSAIRKGKKEGKIEEKIETAKRMLLNDYSMEEVINITGLTEKEVKELMS